MSRTPSVVLLFLATLPIGCSSATSPTESIDDVSQAKQIPTSGPPIIVRPPPLNDVPPAPPPPPVCSASTITWGASQAANMCAGGFEYHPYVAPCYALKEDAACGSPTAYTANTCHWKFDCRKKEFGVERALPDVVGTASYHLNGSSSASCNDFYSQWEDSWTRPNPGVNNGFIYQGYTKDTKQTGWTPDTSNYYGPGTSSCRITFTGVVQYNSFHEVVVASDYELDDYNDNPCPEDPSQPFTCYDYSKPTHWPLCRKPQFGMDPDPSACNVDTAKFAYSAPGISHATFSAGLHAGLAYGEACTSCEDVLIDDPSALTPNSAARAQAKATCLTNRMAQVAQAQAPASTFNATLNGTLVSELKLLAELEGNLLTPEQLKSAWTATLATPDQESCEVPPWTPATPLPAACTPAVPSGVTTSFDVYMRRALTECNNFAQPHATAAAAAAIAPYCFALSSAIPKDTTAGTACGYGAYRDEYRTVANALITKIVGSLAIDPNTESTDEIQSKLASIELWYEGKRTLFPVGSDRTQLWGDTSGVMGGFWQAALSKPFSNVVAANTGASNQFLNDAANVVRKVFVGAFTTTASTTKAPLRSAPLLYLLNDGFLTITGRLEYVGLFHDMACRFKGCIGGNVQTEVSQMWNMLGAIGDLSKLGPAVTSSKMIRTPWSTVFGDMQTTHAQTIQAAAMDAYGVATYSPALLAAGNATTLPTPAIGISQIIQRATVRSNNYINTGLLGSNASNVLDIGLQDATLGTGPGGTDPVTQQIAKLESDLRGEIVAYQGAQQGAIAGILAQLTSQQKDAQLQAQTAQLLEQFNYFGRQIAGLKDSDATQEKAFGQFMQAYDGVTKSDSVDPTLMMQRHFVSATLTPGTATRATSGVAWQDISRIAVQPSGGSNLTVPLKATQGWILNVATTGKWSPTCALRNAPMPGGQTISGAESSPTGPEGYYLSSTSTTISAASETTVDSTGRHSSVDTAAKLCAGVKGEAGLKFLGNGGGIYFDASVCVSADTGASKSHTKSSTSSDASEGRDTASFASGLRLSNTPFPEAPVGALLLVEMASGKTSPQDIIDVRVVQSPNMSVLIDPAGGTDIYLVVNDVAGCSYSSPGALTLSIAELQPAGATFAQIGTAMTKALGDINTAGAGIVAQGKVLPDDMARIRSVAMADLATSVPDVNQVPAALRALFNAYVDEQIVHMERLVEIYNAEYQRNLLTMSFKQIADDIAANSNQARYYELLTAYSMANLDAEWLTAVVNPLLALVTNELYNAAVIRYPAAIPAIQSTMSTQLDAMTTKLDWTNVSVDLANQAAHLVDGIEIQFDSAVHHVPPGQNVTQVVVAFRNPDYVVPVGTAVSPWLTADADSSRAVWNAVSTGSVASIALRPESIYADNAQGALPCSRFAPVIDDMALFLGEPSGTPSGIDTVTANGGQPSILRVHDVQAFSTATGLALYHFSDPTWLLGDSLYAIGGDPAFALQTFTSAVTSHPTNFSAAAGLSPFTTFEVDMAGVKTLVNQAGVTLPEIDLILQLETKPLANPPLSWVSTCAAHAPATGNAGTGSTKDTGTGTTPPIIPPKPTM